MSSSTSEITIAIFNNFNINQNTKSYMKERKTPNKRDGVFDSMKKNEKIKL